MVQFHATPNPNAVKVIMPEPVVQGSMVVSTADDAGDHELAAALMAIDGVRDLFLLDAMITVSKTDDVEWDGVLPKVEEVLQAHLGAEPSA